jgi:phosphoribosylformylglycinamidine cyclo-ligase
MYRVFNMGIGMVLVVPPDAADSVVSRAIDLGERAHVIGEIVVSPSAEPEVEYVA